MVNLPWFEHSQAQRWHINHHRKTARIVRQLWLGASANTRRDPGFLSALTRATWVGSHHDTDRTRLTRNRHWAQWLGVSTWQDEQELGLALSRRLRQLPLNAAERVVQTHTGMTLYYSAVRPRTIAFIHRYRLELAKAVRIVAETESDPVSKVRRAAEILGGLPDIKMPAGGTISCFSGLTPLFACLDPQRLFPVMNQRTVTLLRHFRVEQDAGGVAALVDLIGKYNIKDNLELDVYAYTQAKRIARASQEASNSPDVAPLSHTSSTALGRKSEEVGVSELAKKRIRIRRLHNQLTNRFLQAVRWYHEPRQSRLDILIDKWDGSRWLIIEAKTATSGVAGRYQLRQAIGQLLDYRRIYFPKNWRRVDLALLTPSKPSNDVIGLLQMLGIEALWFSKSHLSGTIRLMP